MPLKHSMLKLDSTKLGHVQVYTSNQSQVWVCVCYGLDLSKSLLPNLD